MPESRPVGSKDAPRDLEREQRERDMVHRVLTDTTELPAKFKDWVTRWIEVGGARLSVNDSIGAYNQPRARVYHSATQSLSTATVTTLSFNSERYDTGAMHDTSTNNSRLTVPKPGVYLVGGHVEFAANATGQRGLYLYLNGATYLAYDIHDASAANETAVTVSTVDQFVVGDYVELRAYQSSGGMLNVNSVTRYTPEFHMTFLADYPRSN